MRIVCIFFVLICLCAGCRGMGSQRINNKIAPHSIVKDNFLPETGAQSMKPPQEMKISEPKKLNALEEPKALISNKSKAPESLLPMKPNKPKALPSNAGNF